jgi:predicted  nucleic acid-binding Zn-ribbon protein
VGVTFYDAQCPRCGHRFGWSGPVKAPPCPRCGFTSVVPDADATEIENFRRFLRNRKAAVEARERSEAEAETEAESSIGSSDGTA